MHGKTNYNSFAAPPGQAEQEEVSEKIIPFVKIDCTLSIKKKPCSTRRVAGRSRSGLKPEPEVEAKAEAGEKDETRLLSGSGTPSTGDVDQARTRSRLRLKGERNSWTSEIIHL